MKKEKLLIGNIPALLWGEKGAEIIVAVHGNMSHKADVPIEILAEEALAGGYQVLSFDLPQHGERETDQTPCKVQECVCELSKVMDFARLQAENTSLFACSMGAYFSLLAYRDVALRQSLFLSPVVDMGRIIDNMMQWFGISEKRLQTEREIATPIGQTLYWDYYCYVKENPVSFWKSPTAILYGAADELCERERIMTFVDEFKCSLEVLEGGEHYFHTAEQLAFFRQWLKRRLIPGGAEKANLR